MEKPNGDPVQEALLRDATRAKEALEKQIKEMRADINRLMRHTTVRRLLDMDIWREMKDKYYEEDSGGIEQ